MTLAFLSFLAGILTILAPCVLPVLPVILAGSVTERQKWYPYIVALSLGLSVVLFTVLLKATTALIAIPPSFWTYLSGGILVVMGFIYLFPHAWTWVAIRLGFARSNASLDKAQDIANPLFRAIVTGAALGPVFSTCSPTYSLLLATVFPVSLAAGIGYTLIYALGLVLMLMVVAVGGRAVVARFRGVADERSWFKKFLGLVFLIIGLSILSGFDKKVETYVLDRFDLSSVEERLIDTLMPHTTPNTVPQASSSGTTDASLDAFRIKKPFSAPEISLNNWINSSPLTMAELKGKVVLIDFWTYSCINCQRTLPYLTAWDKKYRDKGLVIIRVHAPEFAFEKKRENVEKAIKDAGIEYPVVLDNDFTLWNAYANRYWPAKYFIDKDGNVSYFHFGEGAYEESEKIIQKLLGINDTISVPEQTKVSPEESQTPETYLGTARRENMKEAGEQLAKNQWYITGSWEASRDFITAGNNANIRIKFSAKDVYMVLGGKGEASVKVNGTSQFPGKDVLGGKLIVDRDKMYHLVHSENFLSEHELEVTFTPGVQAFVFTFGS